MKNINNNNSDEGSFDFNKSNNIQDDEKSMKTNI